MCRIDDVFKIIETTENNVKKRCDVIKDFQEKIRLIGEMVDGKFSEIAQKYKDPIWLKTADNDNEKSIKEFGKEAREQEKDSTTFNRCGWCKFSEGDIYRYNYVVDNRCIFFEDGNYEVSPLDRECRLKKFDKNGFLRIRYNLSQKCIDKLLEMGDFYKAILSTIKREIDVFK